MADQNATISFAITTASADQKRSTSVGMPLRVGVHEGRLTPDGIDMINERLIILTGSIDTDTAQPMLDLDWDDDGDAEDDEPADDEGAGDALDDES